MAFNEDFKRNLTLIDYCDYQDRVKVRGGNRIPTQKFELQRAIGKISLPHFDGYAKFNANSLVQKLDTYFQLDPMMERDAIRMATFHLEGYASDWWFHGLRTLEYDKVTTYEDFTRIFVNGFDIRYHDMSFRDLAQLNILGTPEAYISEFQKVVVMVNDLS